MNAEEKRQLIKQEMELALNDESFLSMKEFCEAEFKKFEKEQRKQEQDKVIEMMKKISKDEKLQKEAEKVFDKEVKDVRFTI